MSLSRGEIADSNPEWWLISDGKLYFFGKPQGPELFQKDLVENQAKAAANRGLIQKN